MATLTARGKAGCGCSPAALGNLAAGRAAGAPPTERAGAGSSSAGSSLMGKSTAGRGAATTAAFEGATRAATGFGTACLLEAAVGAVTQACPRAPIKIPTGNVTAVVTHGDNHAGGR
ncbi:MAG TPA: hypothetical protein VEQ59_25215, partial [Polyangiaceae bacterium]|nr:hypothetical protein [Polyangiaceae bacterium]